MILQGVVVMNEFVIDFSYRGVSYKGLITPKTGDSDGGFKVILESENQETHLDIVVNPCGEGKVDWCFAGEPEGGVYDKDLLREIGEAIEKYQAQNS